jgi:hypothetical protein
MLLWKSQEQSLALTVASNPRARPHPDEGVVATDRGYTFLRGPQCRNRQLRRPRIVQPYPRLPDKRRERCQRAYLRVLELSTSVIPKVDLFVHSRV